MAGVYKEFARPIVDVIVVVFDAELPDFFGFFPLPFFPFFFFFFSFFFLYFFHMYQRR